MSNKLKVQLPADKVEALKTKYGLTDDTLQDVLQSIEVEPGPQESLLVPDATEENDPFMNSLAALAKKGGGEMAEVMAYSMLMDIQERREDRREERRWKNEERERQREGNSKQVNPESEAVKKEVSGLKETVNALINTMKESEQEKAQKQFAESVVTNVTGQIVPELTKLQDRIAYIEERAQAQPNVDVAKEMKEAINDLGEKLTTKVSAGKITIDDFEPVLSLIDRLDARFKKGESAGELDWKNVLVNTVGEIGKEVVTTYKDIETSKRGSFSGEEQKTGETQPQPPMRGIIKRQLQNYILAKLQGGATSLNIPEAAQKLGLTQQQVFQAYQDLTKEGWFQTVSQGGGKTARTEEAQIEAEETTENQIFKRTEAVFTA